MRPDEEIIKKMICHIKEQDKNEFFGLCEILNIIEFEGKINNYQKHNTKDYLKSKLLPYRIFSSNPLRSSYFRKRNRQNYWWPIGDKDKRIKFLEAVIEGLYNIEIDVEGIPYSHQLSEKEWKIFLYGEDDGQILF